MDNKLRCSFQAVVKTSGEQDFKTLMKTLEAFGLEVEAHTDEWYKLEAKTYEVSVRFPLPQDAASKARRNAGRPRKALTRMPEGSLFRLTTPAKDFLEWFDHDQGRGHTIDEGMAQLGLAKSTFRRWVTQARERVAEDESVSIGMVVKPQVQKRA